MGVIIAFIKGIYSPYGKLTINKEADVLRLPLPKYNIM